MCVFVFLAVSSIKRVFFIGPHNPVFFAAGCSLVRKLVAAQVLLRLPLAVPSYRQRHRGPRRYRGKGGCTRRGRDRSLTSFCFPVL